MSTHPRGPQVPHPEAITERDRFRRLFRGQRVDRPPLFEEGVRDEVLARWHREGLPAGRTHADVFGLVPHETAGPDIRYRQHLYGQIMELSPDAYRQAFDVSRDRFPADWQDTTGRLRDRAHVACLWASRGFFQALGVGAWATLRPVLRAVLQDPAGVRARLDWYGRFCEEMLVRALRDVDADYVFMSEAISDNRGPLISPAMFEDFMVPVYRRIAAVARAHAIPVVVVTYGNSVRLLPALVDAGVDVVWFSEAAEVPETDYHSLRARFGARLGLIGGVPLSLLREQRPAHLRERLRAIVAPLLEMGRYIPLAGGRVREEIPWATYRAYREALNELLGAR